jgi:hypothetical protein
MQIGIDSFGAVTSDPAIGLTVSARQRLDNLLVYSGIEETLAKLVCLIVEIPVSVPVLESQPFAR